MSYLFTSESVSEGHPDKVSDQISDAILDYYLAFDPQAKVAVETLVTTDNVVIAGEVKASESIDEIAISRNVIEKIGYDKKEYMFDFTSCKINSMLHEQSADINRGVERDVSEEQGAGDQGMMFGYACKDTENLMPLPLEISHIILQELAAIRKEKKEMLYLRPDSKSQVTVEYNEHNKPTRIDTIVISTQHDEFDEDEIMAEQIKKDVRQILLPRVIKQLPIYLQDLFTDDFKLFVNPTGKFVIGGPHGDTGLTGRKIIVDTYGGKGAHGGGAFSGKDPSKVDRSAAYAARHIAKNLVAAGVADELLLQLSYAIGVAEPVSVNVNTFNSAKNGLSDTEIAKKVTEIFDLRPKAIEERLKLRNPMYSETASYGHFGREPQTTLKKFVSENGKIIEKDIELFTWEKLDFINEIKAKLIACNSLEEVHSLSN